VTTRRALVTGAGGFIGRWSVPSLLAKGFEVHAVVSGKSNHGLSELKGATLHSADLLDDSDVETLIQKVQPSHLLHFAWIATPKIYWQSPDNERWVRASQHLLRSFAAAGGRRAVIAGSCAEYDWTRAGICHEQSTPLADVAGSAPSPYAASKIALQKWLTEFARDRQLSFAWGRIFFQFGPHEHPDRLVPSVIRHLLQNREALCTHGRQVRSFLHVADVGAAFAHLLDVNLDGAVNVGSEEKITLADLIGRIAAQMGRPHLIRLGALAAPASEPALLVPDTVRLREQAHWRPAFSLDQAVSDTIRWWRDQP
jgi:nucleoside-diphosphate-sugar epimerase